MTLTKAHPADVPVDPAAPIVSRVSRLLGIRYPIVQGGMQWIGRAELASAVSNAGALGILTALSQPTPADLELEISRCRAMTAFPFGINLTMLPTATPPPYEAYLDTAIGCGVGVLETAGNVPEAFFKKAKTAGMTVVHKCTSIRHALTAERRGVDAISIDAFECAGHPGEDDIGGMILFPAAAQRIKIPLIASGGIADGKGMAAALILGAEGINMGTRFCATQEAPIHPNIKQMMVDLTEVDTNLVYRSLSNTGRCLKNAISDEVVAIERRTGGATFQDIRHLVAGARGRAALAAGNVNDGIIWGGQAVALIHDVPTCNELIQRIVRECRQRLHALQGV
jgi:NADH:quinone reductase (non-electrogenic)